MYVQTGMQQALTKTERNSKIKKILKVLKNNSCRINGVLSNGNTDMKK